MNKTLYQFLLFLAVSFICLYLAFSPTVNIPYVNHDSIRYFHKFYNKENEALTYPQYNFEYNLGRPITAEVEGLLYRKVNHLSDMSMLRLITIFLFALSAALLAIIALLAGMEIIPAFCVSTVIFTLPGVQDFIFVPYFTNALAVFFSVLAYFVSTRKLKYGMRFILVFILIETSFYLYPPSTFLFLIPTTLTVLFHHHWQAAKRIWRRDIFLWILAAAVNYITLRVFFYRQIKSGGHEIAFTLKQVLGNALTFFPQGMPQTFNFWNIYYSKALGILMIFFVMVFLIVDFLHTKKMGWGRLFALSIIFLVCNLVWFLFGGYVPREFIASQALALVLVYWCGQRLGNIWPVALLCFGLITANQMVSSNVLNNNSELMFIRSRLAQFVSSSTKEIHVVRMKDNTRGYNGLPRVYDNFNSAADYYEIPDLIRVALKDLPNPFELHCIITYSNYGEPFYRSPDAVVIDMNDLVYISSSGQK